MVEGIVIKLASSTCQVLFQRGQSRYSHFAEEDTEAVRLSHSSKVTEITSSRLGVRPRRSGSRIQVFNPYAMRNISVGGKI